MFPGSFEPVTEFRAGGPHGLKAGEWTDDTSMALALADSLTQVGCDLNDQAARCVAWWRSGQYSVNGRCFDIGLTTHSVLARFERTGDARTSGDRSEHASGNDSIMWLAPVPIGYIHLFRERFEELVEKLTESSLPTHASPQCLSSCVLPGTCPVRSAARPGPYGSTGPGLAATCRSEKSPAAASGGDRGSGRKFPFEVPARNCRFGIRRPELGGRPVGFPPRPRLSRRGVARREFRRRRRHDRGRPSADTSTCTIRPLCWYTIQVKQRDRPRALPPQPGCETVGASPHSLDDCRYALR